MIKTVKRLTVVWFRKISWLLFPIIWIQSFCLFQPFISLFLPDRSLYRTFYLETSQRYHKINFWPRHSTRVDSQNTCNRHFRLCSFFSIFCMLRNRSTSGIYVVPVSVHSSLLSKIIKIIFCFLISSSRYPNHFNFLAFDWRLNWKYWDLKKILQGLT